MRCLWISIVLSTAACSSSETAAVTTDAALDAADTRVDPCGSPPPKAVSGGGDGDECSPSKPCDSQYDCLYAAPGCDAPKGVCRVWMRCPDAAIGGQYCGCDGKEISAGGISPAPFSKIGPCGMDAGGD
jgi:hypothetical protein